MLIGPEYTLLLGSGRFKSHNIYPYWFNANGDWGLLNQETGQWSGSCGMIDRDEVDYAIAVFAATYDRSKIAEFAPANQYEPWHWLTRQPQVVSPIWNLLGLFTKDLKSQIHHNLLNFHFKYILASTGAQGVMSVCPIFYSF